jgi:Mrp family chromosome partitioning ATPase/DUF971 family protein
MKGGLRMPLLTTKSRLGFALNFQRQCRRLFSIAPRVLAEFENVALSSAKNVSQHSSSSTSSSSTSSSVEPLGSRGIVRSVLAKALDTKSIDFLVELAVPFPSSLHAKTLVTRTESAVNAALKEAAVSIAPNIEHVRVKSVLVPAIHSAPENAAIAKAGPGLSRVGSVIAVSSCKGGVGKSTVAVNLAYALRGLGSRVGILDADIHGPSLPTMVSPTSLAVVQKPPLPSSSSTTKGGNNNKAPPSYGSGGGMINALTYENVSLMSYGFVARRNERGERGGAAMRGPMVSQVVQQLLGMTDWEDLDHLVVDMPPGTGDIHITLGQSVPISGAVIVTTPQNLALVDVIKGLDLFNALKVPTLAVVLNMAHFDAPDTGKRYYPFGEGGLERIYNVMDRYNIDRKRLFTLPIDTALSASGDNGVPEVVSHPSSSTSVIYARLAQAVATGVDEQLYKKRQGSEGTAVASVSVKYDSLKGKLVLRSIDENGARETLLDPSRVRKSCRCAACVDELTGVQRLDVNSVKPDISVLSIKEQGNYAVQITWSDGHASGVFPYEQLRNL